MSARTEPQTGTAAVWQDSVQTLFTSYQDGWKRLLELGAELYGVRPSDRTRTTELVERIVTGTREVAEAQVAVAGEWLRAPFWLTGASSPEALQQQYQRLFEARRSLALTYLDAVTGWQQRAADIAGETAQTATETAEAVAERTGEVIRTGSEVVLNGRREVTEAVREAAQGAVEAATDVAGAAVEASAAIAEQVTDEQLPIKGNVNARGERIYHLPGQPNYAQVQAEQRFATEAEAQAAGYRRSQAPGGGTIKAKVNRDGEKIYHLPGQANYDRVEPDMLFETEAEAQAAGFRPAQR